MGPLSRSAQLVLQPHIKLLCFSGFEAVTLFFILSDDPRLLSICYVAFGRLCKLFPILLTAIQGRCYFILQIKKWMFEELMVCPKFCIQSTRGLLDCKTYFSLQHYTLSLKGSCHNYGVIMHNVAGV